LARALASKSRVLILDEPFVNLDADTTKKVIKYLELISDEKIIIIVSHENEMSATPKVVFEIINNEFNRQ